MEPQQAQKTEDSSPSMTLAAKATKPAVAKKSAKKKSKEIDVSIDGTAAVLENLSKDDAISLIKDSIENVDYTYFKIGGALSVIQANAWFHEDGYDKFEDFVKAEFNIKYRRAMYWVGIYNSLTDSGVDWELVKELGWSKLKIIAHLLTVENAAEWVETAKDMTVLTLLAHLKELAAANDDTEVGEEEVTVNTTVTVTFKVHPDQKEIIETALSKAKQELSTEFDAVALDSICAQYLSGSVSAPKITGTAKAPTLTQLMEASSAEEVLTIFSDVYPEVNITAEVD